MGLFDILMTPVNYGLKQEERQWQENQMYSQMRFQNQMMQDQQDFAENFYMQYQSPQAQVQQYKEAGLNPALMFGKGASSATPPMGGTANGSMPSSTGAFQVSSLDGIVDEVFQLNSMKERIDLIEAEKNAKVAEAVESTTQAFLNSELGVGQFLSNLFTEETFGNALWRDRFETQQSFYETKIKQIEKEISEETKLDIINKIGYEAEQAEYQVQLIEKTINNVVQDTRLKRAQVNEAKASAKLLLAQVAAQDLQNYFYKNVVEADIDSTFAEMQLSEQLNTWARKFAERHDGVNPLYLNEFQVGLISALDGIADEHHISIDHLLNSDNKLDGRNVARELGNTTINALGNIGGAYIGGRTHARQLSRGIGSSRFDWNVKSPSPTSNYNYYNPFNTNLPYNSTFTK